MQILLIKLNGKYQVCCHGNRCVHGLSTSFKTGFVISNAFVKTGCMDLCYMYSLCDAYISNFQKHGIFLEILLSASLKLSDKHNTAEVLASSST